MVKQALRTNRLKFLLLLLWTLTFLGFNAWILRLSSFAVDDHHADGKKGYVRKNKDVKDDANDSMNYNMHYDDDAEQTQDEYLEDERLISSWEEESGDYKEENVDDAETELLGGGIEKRGKIAWLMSFPNSGTSFTSLLIRHASNATTASNYGMECNPGGDGKSVPVHDWSLKGPYWLHPPPEKSSSLDKPSRKNKPIISDSGTETGKSGSYNIPPSGASIFTKTHCGSRCTFCPPNRYMEKWQSFLINCLSGSRSVPINDQDHPKTSAKSLKNANAGYQKEYVTYHPSLVEKAVHLLRNPFDNLVSRFHHEQKEHKKRHDTKWTERYSNNAHGFRKWCADEDRLFRSHEQQIDWESWGYNPKEMRMHFEGVACHAEFFRYVQWHNLAIEAVRRLDIPVMYVHYEDYVTNLSGETDRILKFLNLTRVGSLPRFDSNKDYSEFFTLEERAAASQLMRAVASDAASELIEKYWVELDYRAMRKQIQAILD